MSTNEILITKICGSTYVVEYQAYYKIFSLGSTAFTLMLTPLWSSITKAIAEKKGAWVKLIYKKFLLIAGAFSVVEFALIGLIKFIISIWLKDFTADISFISATYMSVICCLMIFTSVLSTIANGTGEIRPQLVCFSIGAAIKIPLSILMVKLIGSWDGVLCANISCMLIYVVTQPIVFWKNKIVKEDTQVEKQSDISTVTDEINNIEKINQENLQEEVNK